MKRPNDPYQWFFPLGVVFGGVGTGLWVAYALGLVPWYPGFIHGEMMATGFLMTVAIGFLMTALPRFTGTESATRFEKLSLFLAVLSLLCVSLMVGDRRPFYALSILEILLLLGFALRRIKKAVYYPPPSFALVAFGVLGLLAANVILLVGRFCEISVLLTTLANLLLHYGLFLGLVLGVGTQLVPSLLGLKRTIVSQIQERTPLQTSKLDVVTLSIFGGYALALFLSFVIEAAGEIFIGRGVRALIVSWVVLSQWRIYLKPKTEGVFSWCLWISAWMLVIGMWPGVYSSSYAIHGSHIVFIGSISLMIFTVATRVTLSHGGHDMMLEKKSPFLLLMLIFLVAALLARLSAPLVEHYFGHLAYAGGLWILAAVCWSVGFMRKVLVKSKT